MEGKFMPVFIFATMSTEALIVLRDLRWMIVLVVILIAADFWFGVNASIKRNEKFRFSRAGRRTCNKFIDYMAYLFLGAIFGVAIFEPLDIATHTTTAAYALGLSCVWEFDSIVDHVCELHGIKNRISIKRIFIGFFSKKNVELFNDVEEQIKKEENEQHS